MRLRYFFLTAALFLTSCANHDENYYRLHPRKLQEALKQCPQNPSSLVTCEKLKQLAVEISQLAYELQMNPQAFGQKIVVLQHKIATKQAEIPLTKAKEEAIFSLKKQ